MTYKNALVYNLTGKMSTKPAKIIDKNILVEEVSQINQLVEGTKIEHEHKPTYEFIVKSLADTGKPPSAEDFYKHIAEDHLSDDKIYYTHLIAMLKKTGETDY